MGVWKRDLPLPGQSYRDLPDHDPKIMNFVRIPKIIRDFREKLGKEACYGPVIHFASGRNMTVSSTISNIKYTEMTWASPLVRPRFCDTDLFYGCTQNQIDHMLIDRMHGSDILDVLSHMYCTDILDVFQWCRWTVIQTTI